MSKLSAIIGEGIGEASMCWSETPKGIFESERASSIVDRILSAVDAELQKESEINKVLTEALRNWLAFEETSIKRDGPYHAKTIPNLMKGAYAALAKAEEMRG